MTSLAPWPPLHERTSMSVRLESPGVYELTCGATAVARIAPAGRPGFAHALGESSEQHWEYSCRSQRRGWIGVVETPDAAAPVAGFYPTWRAGGVIAFEERSYRLRFGYLRGTWRLADDSGRELAALRVRKSGWDGPILAIDAVVQASAEQAPDPGVLLIAIWAMLLEQQTPLASAGGGGDGGG